MGITNNVNVISLDNHKKQMVHNHNLEAINEKSKISKLESKKIASDLQKGYMQLLSNYYKNQN